MKVGIITHIGYNNYGNKLQNYATQEVLRAMGCQVDTIVSSPVRKSLVYRGLHMLRSVGISGVARRIMPAIKRRLVSPPPKLGGPTTQMASKREGAFREFSDLRIKEARFPWTKDRVPMNFHKHYEKFVVGSDQVWNAYFGYGTPFEFLTFAPAGKRIAYAASFGVADLPTEVIPYYKKWLAAMPHISVREDAGASIVKTLTGKDVPVLVDPTLMLTKSDWLAIASPSKHKPAIPFLVTYFLGEISAGQRILIDKTAMRHNLRIVHLYDASDEQYYAVNPSEFLDFLNSSDLIITDSYHGAIFSIIFEKPFVIFDRSGSIPSMTSRIDTLLSKFKLEACRRDSSNEMLEVDVIDYAHVAPLMNLERAKAMEYLRKALGTVD